MYGPGMAENARERPGDFEHPENQTEGTGTLACGSRILLCRSCVKECQEELRSKIERGFRLNYDKCTKVQINHEYAGLGQMFLTQGYH